MAFTEDLAPFFADFGVEAEAGEKAVRVIFDNAYIAQLAGGAGFSSTDPHCLGRTADLGELEEGDPIYIGGCIYRVAGEPQNDGTGVTILKLRKD